MTTIQRFGTLPAIQAPASYAASTGVSAMPFGTKPDEVSIRFAGNDAEDAARKGEIDKQIRDAIDANDLETLKKSAEALMALLKDNPAYAVLTLGPSLRKAAREGKAEAVQALLPYFTYDNDKPIPKEPFAECIDHQEKRQVQFIYMVDAVTDAAKQGHFQIVEAILAVIPTKTSPNIRVNADFENQKAALKHVLQNVAVYGNPDAVAFIAAKLNDTAVALREIIYGAAVGRNPELLERYLTPAIDQELLQDVLISMADAWENLAIFAERSADRENLPEREARVYDLLLAHIQPETLTGERRTGLDHMHSVISKAVLMDNEATFAALQRRFPEIFTDEWLAEHRRPHR